MWTLKKENGKVWKGGLYGQECNSWFKRSEVEMSRAASLMSGTSCLFNRSAQMLGFDVLKGRADLLPQKQMLRNSICWRNKKDKMGQAGTQCNLLPFCWHIQRGRYLLPFLPSFLFWYTQISHPRCRWHCFCATFIQAKHPSFYLASTSDPLGPESSL